MYHNRLQFFKGTQIGTTNTKQNRVYYFPKSYLQKNLETGI